MSLEPLLALAQTAPTLLHDNRFADRPDTWQVFLIGALIVAFAVACYLLEGRTERRWLKVPLALLRAAILLVAVGILFRPMQLEELRQVKHGYTVVAVDVSGSMGEFKDRERDPERRKAIAAAVGVAPERLQELTRIERVKSALRDGELLRRLGEKNRVRLFSFHSAQRQLVDIERIDGGEAGARRRDEPPRESVSAALAAIEELEANGDGTAVGDSLQGILTNLRTERVAAVVLLSDGRSNVGSFAPIAVARRFGRKKVPIFTVGVGDPDPPRNLAVDDLRAPEVTLAGDLLHASFLVRAQGYGEPKEVSVWATERRADEPEDAAREVHRKTITVGGERPQVEVSFTTRLKQPGEYLLTAYVQKDDDESDDKDNSQRRPVEVKDERIRVLYVEGYPRWEYRYLKNALIRDHHMEVQCLLLSADPGFKQEASQGVESLERLPARADLLKFHVIILGDVSPHDRDHEGRAVFWDGVPRADGKREAGALETIKELVKDRGGGLLMISGEQSAPRRFANTPIADLLPILIDEGDTSTRDYSQPYRPQLTRAGWTSDPLRLETNEADNRRLWESDLQPLYWYAPVKGVKPTALDRVLMTHPRERLDDGKAPLAAWHRYGAGTVFWLGIDETWRWRAEVGDKYPYKFYGQILRFLAVQSFTRAKRFYLSTDKKEYKVGEEVRITAEVRDDDERQPRGPEKKQDVKLDVPGEDPKTITLRGVEGEAGKFEGLYKPTKRGRYRLYVDPGERFGPGEVAARTFDVTLQRRELEDPRMDQPTLEAIAAATGGQFLRLDGLKQLPDHEAFQELKRTVLVARTEVDLWDRDWVFLLFFGLLVLEWLGRKLARML